MSIRPSKNDPIVIVGAGIFGLSTALHLARRGYRDVTVFDRQDYDAGLYSYHKGCDAASADLNKIIRSAYGAQTEYQELSFEAIEHWHAWNKELSDGNVPPGMSSADKVFYNSGAISLNSGDILPPFEKATIEAMSKLGHGGTQLLTTDPKQAAAARELGFNVDQFNAQTRGKPTVGVLDTSGGFAVADKACRLALHKARGYGAKFVFGSTAGAFDSLVYAGKEVVGIRTKDRRIHPAILTIMACGAYTPVLVPQLDGLAEATAGSVAVFKIPKNSSLFERLSADNFPIWMFNMRSGQDGGLYGFPVDADGYFKIGYRGTKYTNPQVQPDGKERSVPVTRYTKGDTITQIPTKAMNTIASFVADYLPEILEQGLDVAFTRVCWYTDTFDNHFVIDRVPQQPGLMVATGGSGHAFKYLPNIGDWVTDIIEGVGSERPAVKAWRWRQQGDTKPVNVLMEGKKGARALQNVTLKSQINGKSTKRSSLL
ncbi:FAD dependent oxidoreductase [Dactylonectria macrodidyma]|uniref:FAD dependent oxidoreductase n=1 Tax=Dactylonectria macrodidyma TaxID=307937 RepID=A0A9P9DPJ5_9HYPO|nr:FAD dependent oxidoreductase [Dactylonectria macrodidyma]